MTFIYSKQNPNDKDIFISCLLYRCERIKCVWKMMARNTSLVFEMSGRGPTVPVLPLPPLQWTATASLSSNALSAISRNLSIWFGVGACTSSMGMMKQGNFFQLLLPIFLPKWKKRCANPTRSFLALNISLKRCSGWLQLNFRFGSEMGNKG